MGCEWQVAFLLKIRLVSVKGTCIISLKAPPSDRLWFSFKEMPDIDLVPEQGINERQFKNGCLGNFIANQIKVSLKPSFLFISAPKWTLSSLHLLSLFKF